MTLTTLYNTKTMDDLTPELLVAASKGDTAAFEHIYTAYSSFVYNVAYRVVGNREDAEEVTQEVFLIVHRKLKDFMFRSSLKTWVYRITANMAINHSKRQSRQHKGRVNYEEISEILSSSENVREQMEVKDQQAAVEGMLNQLRPEEKACMVLRNVQGLSYEEIAQSLGLNINTVRTRLKRAREKLLKLGQEVVTDEV